MAQSAMQLRRKGIVRRAAAGELEVVALRAEKVAAAIAEIGAAVQARQQWNADQLQYLIRAASIDDVPGASAREFLRGPPFYCAVRIVS